MAYHFDTQAFLFAAHDMDGGEFAALDTLHEIDRHEYEERKGLLSQP